MGQCAHKKKRTFEHVLPTNDTDSDEELIFRISMTEVSISKSVGAPEPISIVFTCCRHTYRLQAEVGSSMPTSEEWNFEIEKTQRMIESEEFVARVEKQNGEKIAEVRIPLWDIVTGPSVQSRELIAEKGKSWGRFRADIKALQVTILHIQPTSVVAKFAEVQYGNFSLTIKYAGEGEQATQVSSVSESPVWHGLQFHFTSPMTVNSFQSGALQFRIWKHQSKGELMVAECWIGLNKILKAERLELVSREESRVMHSRTPSGASESKVLKPLREMEKKIDGTLWCFGRQIGKMQGAVKISGIPFVMQLHAGVMTEHGVLFPNTESLQLSAGDLNASYRPLLPEQMQKLSTLTFRLKDYVLQQRGSLINPQDRLHLSDLTTLQRELIRPQRDYLYNSESELIEGQKLLMDLGEFLLEYASKTVHASLYYECLTLVCRREELDLGHLSLDRQLKASVTAQKVAVGVRYWAFLRKVLARALEKMDVKGEERTVREFSEYICAISYFRIKPFREQLLECLKQKSYGPVPEWRGTTYDLEEDVHVHPWSLPMFDWSRYFTEFLPKECFVGLDFSASHWQKRLSKRGLAYFRFLSQWTRSVSRSFVQKHVPWHDIPGYHVLLKSFLLELKERPISQYPEALQLASISLLSNPHLISVFLLVLFQKTNVHDSVSVRETIANTSTWLTHLYESGFPLPLTFPDSFFTQGLRITLTSDSLISVASGLWLLYRVYQVLHQEIREELVLKGVLGDLAIGLACHWSWAVRNWFWRFLLYRVVAMGMVALEEVTKVDRQSIERAEDLIHQIESDSDLPTPAGLYFSISPYVECSRVEYRVLRQEFSNWLFEKAPECGSTRKRKYGPFETFPFPDLPLPRAPEDLVDQQLSEGSSPRL